MYKTTCAYIIIIIIIIIIYLYGAVTTAKVHPVHVMSGEQHQVAATKLTNLSHKPCRRLGNYIRHLLLSPKAGTHFIVPRKVESLS